MSAQQGQRGEGRLMDEVWLPWVQRVCADLGVDPAHVDVGEILGLTRDVAHGFERPMAPVAAFIAALAVGQAAGRGDTLDLRGVMDQIRGLTPGAISDEGDQL